MDESVPMKVMEGGGVAVDITALMARQNPDQSPEVDKLMEALSKAQGEMDFAVKDSANPFFKSSYADLPSVIRAIKAPLSNHGLAVIQTTEISQSGVCVKTTLGHSSGQWIRGRLQMRPAKDDPQGIGSAITYARRYALAAIVGVAADEDDDGNAASGHVQEAPPKATQKRSDPKTQQPQSREKKKLDPNEMGSLWKETVEVLGSPERAKELWGGVTGGKKSADYSQDDLDAVRAKLEEVKTSPEFRGGEAGGGDGGGGLGDRSENAA